MDEKFYLKPALLNAAEQFLDRYRNYSDPIKKNDSYDHLFGHYSYNKLIAFMIKIQVCEMQNDECFVRQDFEIDLPYKHFILLEYVKNFVPIWSRAFTRGIDYLKNIEARDQNIGVHQSLDELGLFKDNLDTDAKNLIHEINKFWYSRSNESLQMDIGKEGEEKSFLYEYRNTGNKPYHQSFFDQGSGFDLISFQDNDVKKYIEVKASSSDRAFITWKEWKVACATIDRNELFEFHFWQKKDHDWSLAIIYPKDLLFMGETNKSNHHWKDYIVSFKPFQDRFVTIDLDSLSVA